MSCLQYYFNDSVCANVDWEDNGMLRINRRGAQLKQLNIASAQQLIELRTQKCIY